MQEKDIFKQYNRLSSFLEAYYCEDNYKKINEFRNLSSNEVNTKGIGLVRSITNKVNIKLKSIKDVRMFNSTKGDFSKFNDFDTVAGCVDRLSKSNNLDDNDKTVITAYKNVMNYRDDFKKAYSSNNTILKNLYNSVCYGVISGLSFTISNKVVNANNFGLNHGISNNVIMANLERFNTMTANGQLDSMFRSNLSGITEETNLIGNLSISEDFVGVALLTGGVILGCIAAVHIARDLVYMWFAGKVAISGYLKMLANYLSLNTAELDSKMDNYKKVKKNQEDIAKKLVDMSNKVVSDIKVTTKDVEEETTKEKEAAETSNRDDTYTSSDGDFF